VAFTAVSVIQCTFNKGCSAAEFIFVPERGHPVPDTPPLNRGAGGGSGGGGTILACRPRLWITQKRCIAAFMGILATNKTVDRLEDRLRSLELKCDDLERAKNALNLEFTELYDKVSHQMSRMAKRHAAAAKRDEPELEEIPNNLPFPDADPISRSILLRRGGVGANK